MYLKYAYVTFGKGKNNVLSGLFCLHIPRLHLIQKINMHHKIYKKLM